MLAAFNVVRMVSVPYFADRPVDFRTLYLGQRLLLDGENPYDDALLKQEWQHIAETAGFATEIEPGLPKTPLVYPPWAVALFTVFGPLSYLAASRIWTLVLPLLLVGSVGVLSLLTKASGRKTVFLDLLVIAFAFKATEWAYWVGQPMFLCLFLGVVSWWLADKGRPILAGIALGLAAFKITLVIPFVGLMLYRRRFGVLVTSAMVGAALIATFVILTPDPLATVESLEETVAELRSVTFDPSAPGYPLTHKLITKTELAALAECLVTGASQWASVINATPLLLLAWFWARPLIQQRPSDEMTFSILAVATLLSTHHLHYDCLVLLPTYLVARRVDHPLRTPLLACALVFVLPVNGALSLLPQASWMQPLYFNVQLGLLGLAAVLTWVLLSPPRRTSCAEAPE